MGIDGVRFAFAPALLAIGCSHSMTNRPAAGTGRAADDRNRARVVELENLTTVAVLPAELLMSCTLAHRS